jgi:hypothetical protein
MTRIAEFLPRSGFFGFEWFEIFFNKLVMNYQIKIWRPFLEMKVKREFLTRFGHFQGKNDRDQMTHHPIQILSLEDQSNNLGRLKLHFINNLLFLEIIK